MSKYLALLRGINVSGQKLIKMDALKTSLKQLQYRNIQTYIQSGNVIFETDESNQKKIEEDIHKNILKSFDFEVPVIVRSSDEWKDTFESNPFVNDRNEDISKLYVTVLADLPTAEDLQALVDYHKGPEEFVMVGRNLYIFYVNGAGKSKLDHNTIERKLKVKGTSRNWKTTTKLMDMLSK